MSNAFYDLDAQIRWNQETRELIQKMTERIIALEATLDLSAQFRWKAAMERQQEGK